VKAPLSRYI